MNREQRRAAAKTARKEGSTDQEFEEALELFNSTPSECLMCFAPFDNKNKEHVNTWYVIVRADEKQVNLYCPSCWKKGQLIAKQINDEH